MFYQTESDNIKICEGSLLNDLLIKLNLTIWHTWLKVQVILS